MPLPNTYSDLWRVSGYTGQTPQGTYPTAGPVEFPVVRAEADGPGLAFGVTLGDDSGFGFGTDTTGTNHGAANDQIGVTNHFTGWPHLARIGAPGSDGLFSSIVTTVANQVMPGTDFDTDGGRWFVGAYATTLFMPDAMPWALYVGDATGGYTVTQSRTPSSEELLRTLWPFGGAIPPSQVIYRPLSNSVVFVGTVNKVIDGNTLPRVQYQTLDLDTQTWGTLSSIFPSSYSYNLWFVEAIKAADDSVHIVFRDLTNAGAAVGGSLWHAVLQTDDTLTTPEAFDLVGVDDVYGRFNTGHGCAWGTGVLFPYVRADIPGDNTETAIGCARMAWFDPLAIEPTIVNVPVLDPGALLNVWNVGRWYVPQFVQEHGNPGTLAVKNGDLYFFANQARDGTKAATDGVHMARYTGDTAFATPDWTGYLQYYQSTWTRVSGNYVQYLPSADQFGIVIVERDDNFQEPPGVPAGSSVYFNPNGFKYIDNEPNLVDYPVAVYGSCTDVVPPLVTRRGRSFASMVG